MGSGLMVDGYFPWLVHGCCPEMSLQHQSGKSLLLSPALGLLFPVSHSSPFLGLYCNLREHIISSFLRNRVWDIHFFDIAHL